MFFPSSIIVLAVSLSRRVARSTGMKMEEEREDLTTQEMAE